MAEVIKGIKGQLKQKKYAQAANLLQAYVEGGEESISTKAIAKAQNLREGIEKQVPPAEFKKYKNRFLYFLNQLEKKHGESLIFLDALYLGQQEMKNGEWQIALPLLKKSFSLHTTSYQFSKDELATLIDQCECCIKFEEALAKAHTLDKQKKWQEATDQYERAISYGTGIDMLDPIARLAQQRYEYCKNIESYDHWYQEGLIYREQQDWGKAKENFHLALALFQKGFTPDSSTIQSLVDQCEYGEMVHANTQKQNLQKRKKNIRLILIAACLIPLLSFFGHTMLTSGDQNQPLQKPSTPVQSMAMVNKLESPKKAEIPAREEIKAEPVQAAPIIEAKNDIEEVKAIEESDQLYEIAEAPEAETFKALPYPITRSQESPQPATDQASIARSMPEEISMPYSSTVAILPFCDGIGEPTVAQSLYMGATYSLSKSDIPSISRAKLRASLRHMGLGIAPDQCNQQFAEEIGKELLLGKILVGTVSRDGNKYQITCRVFHPHTSQFGKEFIVSHSDPITLRTKLQHEITSILN